MNPVAPVDIRPLDVKILDLAAEIAEFEAGRWAELEADTRDRYGQAKARRSDDGCRLNVSEATELDYILVVRYEPIGDVITISEDGCDVPFVTRQVIR